MIQKFLTKRSISNTGALFLIFFIGTFLRIYHLEKQSIWLDEARSFFRANKTIQELWANQIQESNPPLYDFLFHYYLKFTNKKSDFLIRIPSVIFGILLMPLAFIVGKTIFNVRTGIFFSFLVAISANHIYYSQEAKMYTLLTLLSLCSFFLYYLSLEKGKINFWIGYTVATILLIYCHNYGILLYLTQIFIYFILSKKLTSNLVKFLLSNLIIFIAFIPRLYYFFQQFSMDYNPWIQSAPLKDIAQTFLYFSLLSYRLEITPIVALAILLAMPIVLLSLGKIIIEINNSKETSVNHFVYFEKIVFLMLYLLLPLNIALLVSFKKPIYVPGRYDMSVFPAYCLLISVGLDKIKKTYLRNFLLSGIIVATVLCLYNYYFKFEKSNDRIVANYIQSRANKDDVLVFTNLSSYAFRYYSKTDSLYNAFSLPISDYGWMPRVALEGEEGYLINEIKKLEEKIGPFLKDDSRIWFMYSGDLRINQKFIEELLKRNYKITEKVKFLPGRSDNQITEIYIFKVHL